MYEQQVKSSFTGTAWTWGGTIKATAVKSVSFLPPSTMHGMTGSFTASYAESDKTTETRTEQTATMDMMSVTVPANGKCAKITTTINNVQAPATQYIDMNVSNWVTVKDGCWGWKWYGVVLVTQATRDSHHHAQG